MKTYEERTETVLEKVKEKRKKQKRMAKWISVASGALAVILAFNLVLFIPYTTGGFNGASYKDSEYYPLIQKLGVLTTDSPVTKNNFHRWFGNLNWGESKGDGMAGGADMGNAAAPESGAPRYEEVTDNQVAGVTEGDLFKRSSDTLFYLSTKASNQGGNDLVLRIYTVNGEKSIPVCDFSLHPEANVSFSGYHSEREMYLSEDLSTVTVVTPCYHNSFRQRYTAVIGVDVSDLNNVRVIRTNYISGSLVSSRIHKDNLIVVSNFTVNRNPNFHDEKQFVPQIGTMDDMKSLPLKDIVLPDDPTLARYTVLTTLDTETAELRDAIALLSYSDETYVSLGNIYVTRSYSETGTYSYGDKNQYVAGYAIQNYTEISRVSYTADGELVLAAQGSVTGSLNNRYSMDEHGETFRIFTTVLGEVRSSTPPLIRNGESANLYVLNTNDLTVRSSVERFAPEGETVQSARFDGDIAYVCTAIRNTDPVFRFDLSDPDRITYKDTGTIPGYSINLTTFYEGTLLGIGYDNMRNLKIELYAEGESSVQSVAVYTLDAIFSENYKAYLIDRENGYIGLAVQVYSNIDYSRSYEYRLLHFDGYDLVEVATVPLTGQGYSDYDEARAFLADGWLYVVDANNFKTVAI